MRHALSIIIFLLVSSTSLAQLSNIDSLQRLLATTKDDTTRVDLMIEMAARYSNANANKTIDYGRKAFALAEKIDDNRRKARAAGMIGSGYLSLGDLAKTTEYWQQRYQLALLTSDQNIQAGAINGIGRIYSEVGNQELGLDYYRKALGIYLRLGNKRDLSVTYNYLGESYLVFNHYDSALFFFRKGVALAKKTT